MSILEKFRLDGKVALVTGASSGFGVGFAQALAQAGADVALLARREDRLQETRALVEAAGRRAAVVPVDVADPAACQAAVDAAVAELGRLDILINNAGMGSGVPALRETPEAFERVMDVNVNGCYWMAQASARAMTDGGAIVNVSSISAILSLGTPAAAYSASKAALLGLTIDLAQQWTGRRGIRVNAVLPGVFETEMTAAGHERSMELQGPRILSGRAGEIDELAAAVLFLASDAAAYVTGQTLVVDGGRSIF